MAQKLTTEAKVVNLFMDVDLGETARLLALARQIVHKRQRAVTVTAKARKPRADKGSKRSQMAPMPQMPKEQ